MPRYFFHVRDGRSVPDPCGILLPSLRAARLQAVQFAGEILRDDDGAFWDGEEWRLEVTDEAALILFTLDFVATDAPTLLAARNARDGAGQ